MSDQTPRGGPVPKRLRPEKDDINIEQTFMENTVMSHNLDDDDSLAMFLPIQTNSVQPPLSAKRQLNGSCCLLPSRGAEAVVQEPEKDGCSVTKNTTEYQIAFAENIAPCSIVTESDVDSENKSSLSVEEEAPDQDQDMDTTLTNNDHVEVQESLPVLVMKSSFNNSTFHLVDVSMTATHTEIVKPSTIPEEDEAEITLSETPLTPDVKNETCGAFVDRASSVFELVKKACMDQFMDPSYKQKVEVVVDNLDFCVSEHILRAKSAMPKIEEHINELVNTVSEKIRSDSKKAMECLTERTLRDYEFVLQQEREKVRAKEQRLRDQDEQMEELKEKLRIAEQEKADPKMEKTVKSMQQQIARMLAKLSKTEDLQMENANLNRELVLLKVHSKLMAPSEGRALIGDDPCNLLNDYLRNHSRA